MIRVGRGAWGWLLAGALGCASGSSDPATTTAFDPTVAGDSTGHAETGAGPSGPASMTSVASADATGQPPDDSCCDVAPTPGCGNAETQACVCTIEEGCCTQVWSQTCVDLAIECNDPACGEPPPATTTGMPPGDSSGEPTQTCDELAAMSGWAYHRCQNGDSQCHSMGTPTTDCDFCCEFCGEAGDVSCGDHATANNWPPGSALCEWNGNGACGGLGYAGTCDCDFCCQI